ncbi:uncharacterized protein Z519_11565 [Cladophialophora bantiana CBS 173.52]|uniref:Uncharacterized protein n=1 Tax=Cladophialophora bantiana (strain ATCC 10958 / CBS 173.52 / CDC B-1940 / NIH 8579) TaxID=1442370 RepID=A0A0D2HAP9_CLAB1|nr:uncharacterized protein Z519_11565 [Cladophialophora bantiana CBS 173.52]KIW87980.1 hypothetical protein Z519_11565 [Cladophialophora bantiana CBS 173.52]
MSSLPDWHPLHVSHCHAVESSDVFADVQCSTLEKDLADLPDSGLGDDIDQEVTRDSNQNKSTNSKFYATPSSFARLAEDCLHDWSEGLENLAASPLTEVNKADSIYHATMLFLWVKHDLLPRLSALETKSEKLVEAKDKAERESEWLRSQIDEAKSRYEEMYEAYTRECVASRGKTKQLGEVCLWVAHLVEFLEKGPSGHAAGSSDGTEDKAGPSIE